MRRICEDCVHRKGWFIAHYMTSDCLLNTDGEDSALGHRSFDSVANAVMSLEVFYTHG